MLFIQFRVGITNYAVDVAEILEILPLVEIAALPGAPMGVAGVINYRGEFVPVIDLTRLATDSPSRRLLSTRILVVRSDGSGSPLLGLLVEEATQVLRREPHEFAPPQFGNAENSWLRPVALFNGEIIQRVDVAALIPRTLRLALAKNPGPPA